MLTKATFYFIFIFIGYMSLKSQYSDQSLIKSIRFTSSGIGLHFIAYFLLSLLGFLSYKINKKLIIILISYGTILEIIQYYLPTRSFNLIDIIANLAGIFLVLILSNFLKN